jgi:hypothetical protein
MVIFAKFFVDTVLRNCSLLACTCNLETISQRSYVYKGLLQEAVGRDIIVGIATFYGLDRSRFETQRDRNVPQPPKPTQVPK